MDDLRIALDLEGVLADTHTQALEISDWLEPHHFSDFGFDDDELGPLLDDFERVWQDWSRIEPHEDDIAGVVADLATCGHVDVVTNTPGASDDVLNWLEYYGVLDHIGRLVMPGPGTYKEELDYQVYIDDNPYLWGLVPLLYLPDRQWNETYGRTVAPDELDPSSVTYYDLTVDDPIVVNSIYEDQGTVVRIGDLEDAYVDLTHRRFNGETAL